MNKVQENNNNTGVNNPHDTFIGKVLRSKPEAVSLLKGVLPKELGEVISLNDIRLLPDTYVNDTQKKFFSDIVYEAKCEKSETKLRIAFVFEHKSYIPKINVKLLVLEYFIGSIKTQLEQNHKPPGLPIVILLYHGTRPWMNEALDKIFGEVPISLKKYIPDFEYIPVLFDDYGNEKVKQVFDSRKIRSTVIVMRDILKPISFEGTFSEVLSEIVQLKSEDLINFIKTLMLYIQSVSKEKYITAADIIKKYSTIKQNDMTIIDEILLEGEKRGKTKGKNEGKIEGKIEDCLKMFDLGFSDEDINKITSLPSDAILLLRKLYSKYGGKTMEQIEIVNGKISEKLISE